MSSWTRASRTLSGTRSASERSPSAAPTAARSSTATRVPDAGHEHVRGEGGVVLRRESGVHERPRSSGRNDPTRTLRHRDHEGAVAAREAHLRAVVSVVEDTSARVDAVELLERRDRAVVPRQGGVAEHGLRVSDDRAGMQRGARVGDEQRAAPVDPVGDLVALRLSEVVAEDERGVEVVAHPAP